jgi:DNA polymerase III delta prime subunit
MELDLHKNIYEKLNYFININKIPNIIFHGPSGSGKRTLVNQFIKMIYYNDKESIKSYVMYVNCAHGKGIKFIREELKSFARTHIKNDCFKSIILSNADKLTTDAQSALRRCIELFNYSTRFFIIVEDKYKLLKPILSRFCEIYIPLPNVTNNAINLNEYHIKNTYNFTKETKSRLVWLKNKILTKDKIYNIVTTQNNASLNYYFKLSAKLYEKGYSAIDLLKIIEDLEIDEIKKYKILLIITKVKKEFRNEKLLMMYILFLLYSNESININENISFI